jgi:hypothetical protein
MFASGYGSFSQYEDLQSEMDANQSTQRCKVPPMPTSQDKCENNFVRVCGIVFRELRKIV